MRTFARDASRSNVPTNGAGPTVIDRVDPFIGTDVADADGANGLAATWWFPKPPIGNTHPGATSPFGMVSACAYSGAYPTGYGPYERSTEGVPVRMHQRPVASGFTHFQQSGTGAIRKYYNYVRITPMMTPLDDLGTAWEITDEVAEPGYYAATLANGIDAEITVGPKSAVHRYTFPEHDDARIVLDASHGGLAIAGGQTVPLRAELHAATPTSAAGNIVMEGVPVCFHAECETPNWRLMPWYDRRLMAGGTAMRFDSIRPTTLRPFGFIWTGRAKAGETIEVRIGFSLRSAEQARANLAADLRPPSSLVTDAVDSLAVPRAGEFDRRRAATRASWSEHVDAIQVEGGTDEQRTVFATALYHSLIKPCFAENESPFWPTNGPFVFDICTMWDIYRTQLPLVTALFPDRAVDLANSLLLVAEEEGNLPIGYRMAKGADRFFRQGSALAHTLFADLCALGVDEIDWDWALCHLESDLNRLYGEDFIELGVAHPISHTLDLALAYHCAALLAGHVGDHEVAKRFEALASRWVNAYDTNTGLVVDSTFYEGNRWNYSFRLVPDMVERIALAGGADRFVELLDRFFGFGADPVKQLGLEPELDEVVAGYALNRFEGLNNEPDMDAPWNYHWAGRVDRTAEIVHAILTEQFRTGPGGIPGNDDSGGLSSWYVWASIGLFPVAGQQVLMVNAPAFRRVRMRLGNGTTFTIETDGFTEPARGGPPQYVQSAVLNGRPLDVSWIPLQTLHRGGELSIELGPTPSDWATTPASASVSDQMPD